MKKLLKHLSEKLLQMYKGTIGNDVKENGKSLFHFYLISCIDIIFINMEKQESEFFLVIMVLRKWINVSLSWLHSSLHSGIADHLHLHF